MATNTGILDLVKPAGNENALISVINSNMDKVDAEAGRQRGNIAANYSTSSAYDVGDLCIYQGNLYRCNTAIASGEEWTAAHWTQVNIAGELDSQKQDIASNTQDIASNTQAIANLTPSEYSTIGITVSSGVSITQGGYFMIGNVCVVMMVLSNTSSIAQYGQLFTGLPKSKGFSGGGNPVNAGTASVALENTSSGVRAFAASAISANSTIRIFTTYIAE